MSPQVAERAALEALERDARKLVIAAGVKKVTDPFDALSELLGEVVEVKNAFRSRVEQLERLTVEDQVGREDVRALLSAYERALDRCGKLLVDAARLNLDERIVALKARVDDEIAGQFLLILGRVMPLLPAALVPVFNDALIMQLKAHDNADGVYPPLPTAPRFVVAPAEAAVTVGETLALPAAPIVSDRDDGGVEEPEDAPEDELDWTRGIPETPPGKEEQHVASRPAVTTDGALKYWPGAPVTANPSDTYAAHLRR